MNAKEIHTRTENWGGDNADRAGCCSTDSAVVVVVGVVSFLFELLDLLPRLAVAGILL